MTYGLAYCEIQEVVTGTRTGSGVPYSLHIIIPSCGSLLMQVMFLSLIAFVAVGFEVTGCQWSLTAEIDSLTFRDIL